MASDPKPRPLTPAQRAVLEKMAASPLWKLYCIRRTGVWRFGNLIDRSEHVWHTTANSLIRRGLVDVVRETGAETVYALTDAGRAALSRETSDAQ